MSVLPNNISWLTSLVHVNDFTKEGPVMCIVLFLNSLIVQFASALSLLSFEGQEAVAWRLHFIEEFL